MKTSNKITLIAGLSALALIGTGYAAWTFSKDATAVETGNVNITTKADEVGKLSLLAGEENIVLTLDQDFIGWQLEASDNDTSDISVVTLEYEGSEAKDYKAGFAVDEDIDVIMTADYGALADYVTFGDLEVTEQKKDYAGEKLTFEFKLPTVSWIDAMYPRNEKAYDDMVAALENEKIEFAFTAAVVECTHQ